MEVALAWATGVAIINEEDDENGDAAHPSPSRILSDGNNETLLYPTNIPPTPLTPRLTDRSPRHQEDEILIESHHELAQMRRHGDLVDAVA